MEWNKEMLKPYQGQWVHCHSVYGMHAGLVHRVLHDGIVLIQVTQLASGTRDADRNVQPGVYRSGVDETDYRQTQFLVPPPGLFLPYGGLYGIWPRPGFII